MNFTSPLFLLFILVVVTSNYFLSARHRSFFLVFSSLVFISYYNTDSLIALLFSAFFNFYFAKKVVGNRFAYITGIAINTLTIIVFNYLSSSKGELHFYFSGFNFDIKSVIIALGTSFYSLQNIAYLTEIYFKRALPESSFLKYVLYTSFFPKIISGPVMLPNEFIPQIDSNIVTQEKLKSGFNRLLLGFFKKLVIADRLSPAVHSIFDFNDNYPGLTTLIGVYLFTIQLYFDFSGYTDMALGAAKMLGYDLKENFNLPFRSTSMSEFWRRWHISLMAWLTIYIYYPVAYRLRRHNKIATLTAIVLIFFISSIWRGIHFTFLAWALCHILYISFELLTKQSRSYLSKHLNYWLYNLFSAFMVFNAVCFSNIFFRAESMEKSIQLIKNIFSDFIPKNWLSEFTAPLAVGGHQIEQFNFMVSLIIPFLVLLFERRIVRLASSEKYRISFVVTCILLIMFFGMFNSGSRFIYMQF